MKKNMIMGFVILAVLLIGGVVASADAINTGGSTASVVDPGTGGR